MRTELETKEREIQENEDALKKRKIEREQKKEQLLKDREEKRLNKEAADALSVLQKSKRKLSKGTVHAFFFLLLYNYISSVSV